MIFSEDYLQTCFRARRKRIAKPSKESLKRSYQQAILLTDRTLIKVNSVFSTILMRFHK